MACTAPWCAHAHAHAHMHMHMHMSMGARRWGVPLEGYSGEEYLQALAERRFTVCCAPVLCPSAVRQCCSPVSRPKARPSPVGVALTRVRCLCAPRATSSAPRSSSSRTSALAGWGACAWNSRPRRSDATRPARRAGCLVRAVRRGASAPAPVCHCDPDTARRACDFMHHGGTRRSRATGAGAGAPCARARTYIVLYSKALYLSAKGL